MESHIRHMIRRRATNAGCTGCSPLLHHEIREFVNHTVCVYTLAQQSAPTHDQRICGGNVVEMGGFEPPSRTERTTQGDKRSRRFKGIYRYWLILDPVNTQTSPYVDILTNYSHAGKSHFY